MIDNAAKPAEENFDDFLVIDWADAAAAARDAVIERCPNCGAPGPKPRVLDVSSLEMRSGECQRRRLFACPDCTCRYYLAQPPPTYHDWLMIGWLELTAQQGAGLWPIDSPIARINKPHGARYLEIGCGFGFGLDFAMHAKGWHVLGIDPAPLAELGCRLLDAPLRQGYFPAADPRIEPWDVMVATEVIEHLTTPMELLRDMRARLAEDGVLLLTTPAGEAITPATAQATLAQLLAPDLHMVFQTKTSLTQLLIEAGFPHMEIKQDATSLVAFASAVPLDLDDDMQRGRFVFRDYLVKRAGDTDPASDIGIGFAGRAMAEAVNDGDFTEAAAMRDRIWSGIKSRFGLDLDRLDHLPPEVHNLNLQRLRFAVPFNLPTVLFAEAMRRLGSGGKRAEVRRELSVAAEAAALLIRALAAFSLNDGMTEEIAWQAQAELAIADAEAGDPAILVSLQSLPRANSIRHRQIAWRALIALGNADALDLAAALVAQEGLQQPDETLPAHQRRDVLAVLGRLALMPDSEPMRAVMIARELGNDPAADDLLLVGFIRLVNASRYHEAAAAASDVAPRAAMRRDDVGIDARLALAVLDLTNGDPADVPGRLEGLGAMPERGLVLLLGAFTKLVNLARYREAMDFSTAHDIAAIATKRGDAAGRNARLALAVLDLMAGDPALAPSRLEGLEIDPARRDDLVLGAFTRLVNMSRFDDAVALASAERIGEIAMQGHGDAARDARLALAVLDLTQGDPADVPARLRGLEVEPPRRRALMLGAFTRLVNAARFDDAMALREAAPIRDWSADTFDPAGADATYAAIMLELAAGDPALVPDLLDTLPRLDTAERDNLLLQAFLRLAQKQPEAARDLASRGTVEGAALRAAPELRDESLIALMMLDIRPGGRPDGVAARLDAWQEAGLEPLQVKSLARLAFVSLVNAQSFEAAAMLRPRIEPDFSNFAKATTMEARDAGYALGVLHLQSLDPEHQAQPFRAEAAFSAVRRGFADQLAEGEAAPPLFWEALRGEMVALNQVNRGSESATLGRAMLARYRGAPADLAHDFAPPS
jgi:SAM-dependent methyltransferase